MSDGRKRTRRMPLGTWFWMPFFEKRIQTVLARLKDGKDEHFALEAYCEAAAMTVGRDSDSCLHNRKKDFEAIFRQSSTHVSEILFEIAKFDRVIRTKPARRHKVAAFSEAKSPAMWTERGRFGIRDHGRSNDEVFAYGLMERFAAPLEPKLISWKELNFPAGKWTALNVGKWAEAERSRRFIILKRWPQIKLFAPKSILPKS